MNVPRVTRCSDFSGTTKVRCTVPLVYVGYYQSRNLTCWYPDISEVPHSSASTALRLLPAGVHASCTVVLATSVANSPDTCISLLPVCVCVFFPFILDIKFVGRTSRGHTGGRSHRISHPPSFCGACLNFTREKDSAIPFPLVEREVEFCVLLVTV